VRSLLDSVILIDHFNGIAAASACLGRLRSRAVVSVVTRAEVLAGFGAADLPLAAALLDHFPTLGIDRETADLAARLRREVRWKMPDAFQAAIAQRHGLRLVTRNTKDFPPERHPFVEVPYTV
jgi:predicted nucleic acid-binding protein